MRSPAQALDEPAFQDAAGQRDLAQDVGHVDPVTGVLPDESQGGGHGGSHPHLVHEFVSALCADREPWPNATASANWTGVGICAHQSALRGGQIVYLPEWTWASS